MLTDGSRTSKHVSISGSVEVSAGRKSAFGRKSLKKAQPTRHSGRKSHYEPGERLSVADASVEIFGPDPLSLLVEKIRESTAREIEEFVTERASSSESTSDGEEAEILREQLYERSQRILTFSPGRIENFCSGLHPNGAPSLDLTDQGIKICEIIRENDEPYKFSIRRQGKCLYFEKAPTEWESGTLPDVGDRLLSVNGIRADNIKTHDAIFKELATGTVKLHFGNCADFPDQEAFVLVPIVLNRRMDEALGVRFQTDKQWCVFDVIADGVFKEWNARNPELRVRPYDRLLSVNGVSGFAENSHIAMKELDRAHCLNLLVAKLKTNPDPYNSFILFDLIVKRNEGSSKGSIGLRLQHRGHWLVVHTIHPDGAMQNIINKRPFAMAAAKGDMIIMLNGIPGDEANQKKLISNMETSNTLHFTFAKCPEK